MNFSFSWVFFFFWYLIIFALDMTEDEHVFLLSEKSAQCPYIYILFYYGSLLYITTQVALGVMKL
jgi:hypothetical protein